MDKVITVDGVHRMVIAINESIPGPPIIAYETQNLRVHVKNLLLSDAITIHWHGLPQKDTPFMDGIGYVSQCPIAAGQSFTYEFKVCWRTKIVVLKSVSIIPKTFICQYVTNRCYCFLFSDS